MHVLLDLRVDFRDPERDQLCLHPEKVQTQEEGRIASKCYLAVAYLLHKRYGLSLAALDQNAYATSSTLQKIREGQTTWEEALGLKGAADE